MNFIGDIMLGRRFESDDGIITNQGADASDLNRHMKFLVTKQT